MVADPWRLLPRRPAPDGTGILQQLAFRQVQLVLADTGMMISSAREYALLGRLMSGSGSVPAQGWPRQPSRRSPQHGRCPAASRPGEVG